MNHEPEASGLQKVLYVAGESVVPGGSNLIKGDLREAGIFAALGFAARAAFGIPGLILVSASSLTQALTGRSVVDAVVGSIEKEERREPAPVKTKP